MPRPIRCTSCGERFYAPVDHEGTECQNCTGTHDPMVQARSDAAALERMNVKPADAPPQSIDPRNPTAPKKGKK